MIGDGDVFVFDGGELVLSGPAVLWFATAVELALGGQRKNAAGRNPVADRYVAAIAEAARRTRQSSVDTTPELPQLVAVAPSQLIDPVGTEDVAKMLDCSAEWARRLCRRESFESARLVRGRWLVERSEVAERVRKAS